jgi:hypothetical protein
MNFEKNDNSDKIIFNKWLYSTPLEENTKPIVTKKNEYSSLSYHTWLSVKNYLETTSNDDNKPNIIKNNKLKKNKIKIYTLIFDKLFMFNKLKINNMNFYSRILDLKKYICLNISTMVS